MRGACALSNDDKMNTLAFDNFLLVKVFPTLIHQNFHRQNFTPYGKVLILCLPDTRRDYFRLIRPLSEKSSNHPQQCIFSKINAKEHEYSACKTNYYSLVK